MSNHLAIATITATLQRILQAAVQNDVEGARITTVSPSDVGKGTPETGVNIFMYQVITNPALHNIDATPFRSRGTPTKRQAALDMFYMLSFYGNNNELTPQRLLGSVVQTLNDKRMITQDMIREACNDSTLSFLRESNLADQIQQMNVLPLDLTLEDLSKTWSVFFQTPYMLSVAYKVMVVMVEGKESYARGLPVRDRRTGGIAAFPAQPLVEKVVAQGDEWEPILITSTLIIKGRNLKGDTTTHVRIGGSEVTPTQVTSSQITLPLSTVPADALRAGVQSLQVLHTVPTDHPNRQHQRMTESNAAPFVLRPRVLTVALDDIVVTDDDLRNATVTLTVNLTIGRDQRVVLALNECTGDTPSAYMFDIPQREQDAQRVMIPIQDVKAGDYLVRLLIDGAESQLVVDDDRNSPTFERYIGPIISLPCDMEE
ncbi:MAG: Pvc16 family protein [Leptolyngbyaceae bacterium]|nr:Pvc16 family protein [Leptolyngbyaceae bacterium]